MAIKLLIVEDSAFMRKIISDVIAQIPGIEVVGIARNGLDALEVIPRMKPDIITLDIEMPKLNGIETLKRIKKKYDIPVIMLSSLSGTDITIEALDLGAIDFIPKPERLNVSLEEFKRELEIKIKAIVQEEMPGLAKREVRLSKCSQLNKEIGAIAIGASTGGPRALNYLISSLPETINIPIFIVQHMPKGFTTSFAERLDREAKIKVVEAKDNMIIERNTVYLAPGDYHMLIEENRISLNSKEKIYGVRPAVDYLFESAARKYKERLLGIILTGMGRDGAKGMKAIKEFGGCNIAQSEESCVVYGMPRHAVESGVVDAVLGLEEISNSLNKLLKVK